MDKPLGAAHPASDDDEQLAQMAARIENLERRLNWWEALWKRILGQAESLYRERTDRSRR